MEDQQITFLHQRIQSLEEELKKERTKYDNLMKTYKSLVKYFIKPKN